MSNHLQQQRNREDQIRKLKDDYEKVFSTEAGKRVLEDIRKSSFFYKTSFNSDSLVMAHNEGRRMFGLHVVDMATPQSDEVKDKQAIK